MAASNSTSVVPLSPKPRLTYAQFIQVQALPAANTPGITVGELIERYIDVVGKMRTLGESHLYALRALQRRPIADKIAVALTPQDVIDHCQGRIDGGVGPATVNQDITFLRGPLSLAKVALRCNASVVPILEAMPLLKQMGLVAKSRPRDRRPTPEELERLLAFFRKQDQLKRTKIPMVVITEFSYLSGRRISETCRLKWSDLDVEKRTCWVRDLKDSRRKKGTGNDAEFPLLGRAFDIVMAQPRIPGEDRIFPYNKLSCSMRYCIAKKRLGIVNLRLHDNRRECASRMMEDAFSVPEVMLVTLHKSPTILLRTYTKLRAEDLHKGPAAKRGRQALKDVADSVYVTTAGRRLMPDTPSAPTPPQ